MCRSEKFAYFKSDKLEWSNSIFRDTSATLTSISTRNYQWFTSWICKRMLTRPLKQDYPRDETKFIALEMFCHDDGWRKEARRSRQGNLSESMRLKRAMCYLIDFDCFLYFTVYVIWISNILRDNAASISETSLPQDFDNSFRKFLCVAVNCVLLDGISNVNVSFRVGNFIRNVDECWLRTDNKVTTSTSLMLIVKNSSYLPTHLWSAPTVSWVSNC